MMLGMANKKPSEREVREAAKIFASAGGYARSEAMTPEQRSESARIAGKASGKARKAKSKRAA